MGTVTIDDANPGRRQYERYSVNGSLSTNRSDQDTRATEFLLLKNCSIDKRLNAVLKRGGSITETISGTLGVPNGIGEYIEGSPENSIANKVSLLASFGGSQFRAQEGATWSTVNFTARCNFSSSRPYQFTKLDTMMLIAGGRPARWLGPGTTIDRIGIVPPTEPPGFVVDGSPGMTLIFGAQYMYTFYDSSTGLESDWSDLSLNTGPVTDQAIIVGIPNPGSQNWDRVRLYRTLDGGAAPYLVATLIAGTSPATIVYIDTTEDAALTEQAEDRFVKVIPPDKTFVCANYASCFWLVNGDNPYELRFSKPFVGNRIDLEYFPIDNIIRSNEPITGLLVVPGKMLIFHARSISYVSGFSTDDFVFQPFLNGTGTTVPGSISTNGTDIVFLGEEGWQAMPGEGGVPRPISREIKPDLDSILSRSYNAIFAAASCWNTALRQFIFILGAQSVVGAPWEEVGTGSTASAVAGWQTVPGLVDDIWEDVSNPNSTDVLRVKIWGWSPELSQHPENVWMEYTLPGIADNNVAQALPVYLLHPQASSDVSKAQQDRTYFCIFNGIVGEIRSVFRTDYSKDDATIITSELITGRIIPGLQSGGFKLFQGIGFQNAYSDPMSDGFATLKYLIDFDDPQLRSFAGNLITITDATHDYKRLTTMLGRHLHLYLIDISESQSKILLGEFFIHYRERMRRDGR